MAEITELEKQLERQVQAIMTSCLEFDNTTDMAALGRNFLVRGTYLSAWCALSWAAVRLWTCPQCTHLTWLRVPTDPATRSTQSRRDGAAEATGCDDELRESQDANRMAGRAGHCAATAARGASRRVPWQLGTHLRSCWRAQHRQSCSAVCTPRGDELPRVLCAQPTVWRRGGAAACTCAVRLWLGDAVLTIAPLWTLLLQHVLVKRDGIEQFLTQAKGVKPKWMDVRTHQLATLVLFAASAHSRGCVSTPAGAPTRGHSVSPAAAADGEAQPAHAVHQRRAAVRHIAIPRVWVRPDRPRHRPEHHHEGHAGPPEATRPTGSQAVRNYPAYHRPSTIPVQAQHDPRRWQ